MNGRLAAAFSSYREAEEAARKLLSIRAEQIAIELADPPEHGSAAIPIAGFGAGSDSEFAGELPPYEGEYRLTAAVRPEAKELADRIIRACGGRTNEETNPA